MKKNLEKCKKKLTELELIEEYYNTFFSFSKKEIIILINQKLKECKKMAISEILDCDRLINNSDEFNLEEAIEESKNVKYKNSCFFMAIYNKNRNENNENKKNENVIFNESKSSYKDTLTKLINKNESKEANFQIYVNEIVKAIQNKNNDIKKEIDFTEKEFESLGKKDYISNNLLNDIINFSNKDNNSKSSNDDICLNDTNIINHDSKINNINDTNIFNLNEKLNKSKDINIQSNNSDKTNIKNYNNYSIVNTNFNIFGKSLKNNSLKSNNNSEKLLTIIFTFEKCDKHIFIEINENETFSNVIKKLEEKYEWLKYINKEIKYIYNKNEIINRNNTLEELRINDYSTVVFKVQ